MRDLAQHFARSTPAAPNPRLPSPLPLQTPIPPAQHPAQHAAHPNLRTLAPGFFLLSVFPVSAVANRQEELEYLDPKSHLNPLPHLTLADPGISPAQLAHLPLPSPRYGIINNHYPYASRMTYYALPSPYQLPPQLVQLPHGHDPNHEGAGPLRQAGRP